MKPGSLVWLVVLPACTVAFDLSTLEEGCDSTQKECDDGTCADRSDPRTGCAQEGCQPCSVPNGIARCSAEGKCVVLEGDCLWPYEDCDLDQKSCESNTATDPPTCGECDVDCTVVNLVHARPACNNGACAIGRCDPGYADCDGETTPGCETDLETSPLNCGDCLVACAVGQTCAAGVCTP